MEPTINTASVIPFIGGDDHTSVSFSSDSVSMSGAPYPKVNADAMCKPGETITVTWETWILLSLQGPTERMIPYIYAIPKGRVVESVIKGWSVELVPVTLTAQAVCLELQVIDRAFSKDPVTLTGPRAPADQGERYPGRVRIRFDVTWEAASSDIPKIGNIEVYSKDAEIKVETGLRSYMEFMVKFGPIDA